MSNYTIYSEGVWEQILEKYPKVKSLTTKLGISDSPYMAKEIQRKYEHPLGYSMLNPDEKELGINLLMVEFRENDFLKKE